MSLNEKQLDALGKQHKEMLDIYANKIKNLQATEIKITDNIRNMNKVINDHVAAKQKELNDKIAETEKLKLEAITIKKEAQELLYTAQNKIEEANNIHNDIMEESLAHDKKVKDHVDTVSSANNDIDRRHGECAIREEKCVSSVVELNKRIDLALLTEKKAQEEINKLKEMNECIKSDIEVQKDLYFKNKQLLDDINKVKLEVDNIKLKSDKDMSEAIKIRDDVDKTQARIERTSQEIIRRNDECKAREIQIKVTEQLLKDRKLALDSQEGRLNELRNNVNSLLEKQQATVSTEQKEGA